MLWPSIGPTRRSQAVEQGAAIDRPRRHIPPSDRALLEERRNRWASLTMWRIER